jgi:hypothetical protein
MSWACTSWRKPTCLGHWQDLNCIGLREQATSSAPGTTPTQSQSQMPRLIWVSCQPAHSCHHPTQFQVQYTTNSQWVLSFLVTCGFRTPIALPAACTSTSINPSYPTEFSGPQNQDASPPTPTASLRALSRHVIHHRNTTSASPQGPSPPVQAQQRHTNACFYAASIKGQQEVPHWTWFKEQLHKAGVGEKEISQALAWSLVFTTL